MGGRGGAGGSGSDGVSKSTQKAFDKWLGRANDLLAKRQAQGLTQQQALDKLWGKDTFKKL